MHRLSFVTLAALILAGGCAGTSPEAAGTAPGAGGFTAAAVIARSATFARWPSDPIRILGAAARGDTLYIDAEHGGGCAVHGYALVVDEAWRESDPVQVGAKLAHDANGDNCRAIVRPRLAFSLRPLREAYARTYGPGGTIVIVLAPEGPAVRYTF